jgi:hypothetical protein
MASVLRRSLQSSIYHSSIWGQTTDEDRSGDLLDEPRVIQELKELAAAVASQLDRVSGNSLAARTILDDLRSDAIAKDVDTYHDEIEATYAELESSLREAEAAKIALLETEAVHIDGLLQVCRL